jgi:hypothetical protein
VQTSGGTRGLRFEFRPSCPGAGSCQASDVFLSVSMTWLTMPQYSSSVWAQWKLAPRCVRPRTGSSEKFKMLRSCPVRRERPRVTELQVWKIAGGRRGTAARVCMASCPGNLTFVALFLRILGYLLSKTLANKIGYPAIEITMPVRSLLTYGALCMHIQAARPPCMFLRIVAASSQLSALALRHSSPPEPIGIHRKNHL